LLHCIFKDKFGNSRYIWTPPWKGESGVESLFFKALEIEEWNDYDGAWSKELRKAAQEIPSLEEIKLPIKIKLGGMTELPADEKGPGTYRATVQVLNDELNAWIDKESERSFLCIGEVKVSWESFKNFLLEQPRIRSVSKGMEKVGEFSGSGGYGEWEDLGVRFYVWLELGADKSGYEVIGRELVSCIRSFIRKRLSDYRALKRGFDELA
jgi:hypothetical protein